MAQGPGRSVLRRRWVTDRALEEPELVGGSATTIQTFDDHTLYYAGEERARLASFLDAADDRRAIADVAPLEGSNMLELVEAVCGRLAAHGTSAYAVDVTSPDVAAAGLSVVHVLAPELCQLDVVAGCRFLAADGSTRPPLRQASCLVARLRRPEPRPASLSVNERLRAPRQTARWLELVYGGPPDPFDPAESYHEASKVSPTQIGRQVAGAARLETIPDLQLSMTRAVRRLPVPRRTLPAPRRPDAPLCQVLVERRSCRRFSDAPLSGHDLAGLLESAYGVTHALEEHALPLRAVPSGGALYPLELYVAALRIEGLEPGLYHFDPLAPALAVVHDSLGADDVPRSRPTRRSSPGAPPCCSSQRVRRTRFKYGVRGIRFALLEVGHVAQNVLLTATAFGLGAVPLGVLRPADRRVPRARRRQRIDALHRAVGSLPDG